MGKSKIARFGCFELLLDTAELRKYGIRVHLQMKAFQILRALIEQPGRVITREQLREHLWPEGVFVDFESGLNSAANRLRRALGDSAGSPIYIETLPRIGYRFIAPVTILEGPANTVIDVSSAPPTDIKNKVDRAHTRPTSVQRFSSWIRKCIAAAVMWTLAE